MNIHKKKVKENDVDLCIWRMEISFFFFTLPNSHSHLSSPLFSLSLCRDLTVCVFVSTWFHVNFCSEYRDFFGFLLSEEKFFLFFNYINSKYQRVEQRRYIFFASERNMSSTFYTIAISFVYLWLACIYGWIHIASMQLSVWLPQFQWIHRAHNTAIFQSENCKNL